MSGAPHPRMHGLTHVPGGPDPIPGLVFAPTSPSFPEKVAELAAVSPDRLLGYWRLGEGAAPYLDTSGHSYGPSDLTETGSSVAMSNDVTGALPTADDDG